MSRCVTPVSGLFLEGSNCNPKGLEMMLSFSGGQRNLAIVTAWAPGPGARKAPKEQKQPLRGQAAQLEASLGSVGSAKGQAFSLTEESRDQTAWAEPEQSRRMGARNMFLWGSYSGAEKGPSVWGLTLSCPSV